MCEAPSLPEREGGGFAVPAFADSLSPPPNSMNDETRRVEFLNPLAGATGDAAGANAADAEAGPSCDVNGNCS